MCPAGRYALFHRTSRRCCVSRGRLGVDAACRSAVTPSGPCSPQPRQRATLHIEAHGISAERHQLFWQIIRRDTHDPCRGGQTEDEQGSAAFPKSKYVSTMQRSIVSWWYIRPTLLEKNTFASWIYLRPIYDLHPAPRCISIWWVSQDHKAVEIAVERRKAVTSDGPPVDSVIEWALYASTKSGGGRLSPSMADLPAFLVQQVSQGQRHRPQDLQSRG